MLTREGMDHLSLLFLGVQKSFSPKMSYSTSVKSGTLEK